MSVIVFVVICYDWFFVEVCVLFEQLFNDLLFQVQMVYCVYFDLNCVQVLMLLLIKIGVCFEDCKYCLQFGYYNIGLDKEKLMEVQKVFEVVVEVKVIGLICFCMGVVWKYLLVKDMFYVLEMVKGVKKFGLEICMIFGCLIQEQIQVLVDVGFDYYNYNLDILLEFYGNIIIICIYSECLQILVYVCEVGMKICFGGIFGMGELVDDCVGLLI